MSIKRNTGDGDLPTVISDLNGKIIHVNNKAILYVRGARIGGDATKYIDFNYLKKMSFFDNRIDVMRAKNCRFEKAAVKISGTGVNKTVKICFVKGDADKAEELLNDKRLFASYPEIMENNTVGKIVLDDFVSDVIDSIKADLRLAYRRIDVIKCGSNREMSIKYIHLSAIITGTVFALNEIDYRIPISVVIERALDKYIVKVSLEMCTFKNAQGLHAITELFPQIAMRFIYITNLCDDDGIEYELSVKPDKITAAYILNEEKGQDTKLSSYTYGKDTSSYVSYIMGLFAYDGFNDTAEEEQE